MPHTFRSFRCRTFGAFLFSLFSLATVATAGGSDALPPGPGAVEVRVTDPSGALVPGADVFLQRGTTIIPAEPTGDAGVYRFTQVPLGRCVLTVYKAGFAATSQDLQIGSAETFAVAVTLAPQSVTELVTVEGAGRFNAPAVVSATRLPANPLDVPQSVDVVTRALIQSQGALSLSDALQNVTGITPHMGEGRRDQVTIRGFSALNDTYIDGVRDDARYYRDLSNLEQVEVVKGPAAALFGRGSSGGVVNRVTKKPIFGAPLAEVSIVAGSYDRRRVAADVGGAVDDRRVAMRLTGAYEDSGSHRPHYSLERIAIAPSLAWRPRSGSELLVQAEFLSDDRLPDRGVPSFQGRPVDAARDNYYGYPEDDYLTNHVASPSVAWQQSLGRWTLRNIARATWYDNSYSNTYASGVKPVGGRLVATRGQYGVDASQRNLFDQVDATTLVNTWGIDHAVLVGTEIGAQRTSTVRATGTAGDVDLFAPELTRPVYAAAAQIQNEFNGNVVGLFFQDQITLGTRWRALVGARFDRYEQRLDDHTAANRDLGRTDQVWSPRAGLVFRTTQASSLYASVSRSFQPSGDGLSLAVNNEELEPELTTAYEGGVKADIGRLTVTAAVFRLDRTNVRTTDPLNPGMLVLVGRQRSDGVELSAGGALTRAWDVRAGVTFLDPEILRSNDVSSGVPLEGNRIGNVATRTASVWSTYAFRSGLSIGGGAFHVGDWFTSNDNLVHIDAYTRVDAVVGYRFSRYEVAVNLRNLLDAEYFETSHSNSQIMPAAGRNGLVTLRYRW